MFWYCTLPSLCSSCFLSSIYTYIVFNCFDFQGLLGTLCALEALDVHLRLLNYCACLWCDIRTDVYDVHALHSWHAHNTYSPEEDFMNRTFVNKSTNKHLYITLKDFVNIFLLWALKVWTSSWNTLDCYDLLMLAVKQSVLQCGLLWRGTDYGGVMFCWWLCWCTGGRWRWTG